MNANHYKKTFCILLIILAVNELSCAAIFPQYINTILSNPQHYKDKKVTVKGEVVQIFALPFIDKGFCQIKDDTGEIWVKPAGRVPNKGEIVTIKGVVNVGFTFEDKTFGIIIVEDYNQ